MGGKHKKCIYTDDDGKGCKFIASFGFNKQMGTKYGKFVFIRFNPDKYINKNGTTVNPSMKKRMDDLQNEINIHIKRINAEENTELLELHYLYYDKYN